MGLSLEGITVGEEVVVSGSLQKEAGAAPVGDYFVRPVEQVGIQRCSEHPARTLYVHLDGFRNDYVQREDWDTPVFDALISGRYPMHQCLGRICEHDNGKHDHLVYRRAYGYPSSAGACLL